MKLGFIGCGNMGKAIMGGIIKSEILRPEDITGADAFQGAIDAARAELGINVTLDNREVARQSDVLFLSVKPQFCPPVIEEIKDVVREDTVIVSIMAGQSIERLTQMFGRELKIVRCMPNTPALVGEGMTAAAPNKNVTEEEVRLVCGFLDSFGRSEVVDESLMTAVTSVSGSSPAYVFMFIEAMADAAVRDGMPRKMAYKFAAQAVLGSAKMVLETGRHPGELKDMVTSPAGTTIEACRVLEQKGLRSAVIEAMEACSEKSKNM